MVKPDDVELTVAYNGLIALRDTFDFDAVDEGASAEHALEKLLFSMSKKLDLLQSHNLLEIADEQVLKKHLNVRECRGGILAEKDDWKARVRTSSAIQPQRGSIWSSKNLQKHLTALEQSVQQVEGSARSQWIDAFLFRAAAMVSTGEGGERRMVWNTKHIIPTGSRVTATTMLAGQIDYSVIVAEDSLAQSLLEEAHMGTVYELIKDESAAAARGSPRTPSISGFFVVEMKPTDARPSFMDHIAQAVAELFACATLLQQKFLRGALTNGHTWVFIIVRRNDSEDGGGKFKRSMSMSLEVANAGGNSNKGPEVNKYSADRIAGVLAYWIEHSFEDVGEDDWFERFSWD